MYASSAEQRRDARVQVLAEKLHRERYPYLLRIAAKHAPNHADAEEAVSEAFASFLRAFDPGGGAPPLAWLTLYADLRVMPTLVRKAALQARIAPMRSA